MNPKVIHSTPRVDDLVVEKSSTLFVDSLTSTIESEFHENNMRNFDESEDENVRKRVSEDDIQSLDDISTKLNKSSMSFLNENENWRGLTKKTELIQSNVQGRPKKRGKYLTPCPDIQIIRQRPKFSLNLPLLVNGNSLGPAKIGKQFIAVRNTCAFDSIVQSMLTAYHDFATYYQHITESKNAIHDFVEALSKSGVSSKLYNERCVILKHTSEIKNGVLDCEINVATLIELHILPNTPSLEIKINCNDCQYEKISIIPVLELNPDPIFKEAMRGLQEAVCKSVEHYVSKTRNECCFCKGTNITKTFAGGSHIFLNLEAAEIGLLAARRGLANCRKQFTLSEIPGNLNYCDRQYKMVSAIIFVAGHYYACIKRATGSAIGSLYNTARTEQQLKKCWDNLKTRRKGVLALQKKERMRTGGGPFNPDIPSASQSSQEVLLDSALTEQTDVELMFAIDSDTPDTHTIEDMQTNLETGAHKTTENLSIVTEGVNEPLTETVSRNIRTKVIEEEFSIRRENYKIKQKRDEELHKLKMGEYTLLVKAAEEKYLKTKIEREAAEELLLCNKMKKEEAELKLLELKKLN
ncbi:unnamed protein product, partial [Brenthis ino]